MYLSAYFCVKDYSRLTHEIGTTVLGGRIMLLVFGRNILLRFRFVSKGPARSHFVNKLFSFIFYQFSNICLLLNLYLVSPGDYVEEYEYRNFVYLLP